MKPKKKSTLKGRGVSEGEKPPSKAFLLQSKVYFLTYKGISDSGQKITKNQLANYLLKQNPNDLKLRPEKYLVCEQTYQNGEPHFHVILVYEKRKQIGNSAFFDYLGIHPNIQTMRNMKAALEYVYKEDKVPLTNMDIVREKRVARAKDSSSLYQLLEDQMKKDPFNFQVYSYCKTHDLFKQIYKANYTKAVHLVIKAQQAECKHHLRHMSGIQQITPQLIAQKLSPEQQKTFYSVPEYQRIINHINQAVIYPNKSLKQRLPDKTPHLYLVGPSDIGKSAFVTHHPNPSHPFPGLDHYFSTYYLNVSQRYFPPYDTYMSSLVYWDQFVLNSTIFPKTRYNQLLTYLSGQPTQIPIKGRTSVRRMDNPKHILTSNRTLQQQICATFKSQQSRSKARMNLRSRLDQVILHPGFNLHFLRKLFVPVN